MHPVSVPTCHLRPALAELMRGLGPHAQPWDRAPTLPPAGAHHTSTFIWKTWQRQGGLLHTCWAETPLTADVQGHAGCLFGHSFMDEIVCAPVCAFAQWCTNKRVKIRTWRGIHRGTRRTEEITAILSSSGTDKRAAWLKGNQEAKQVCSPRKRLIWRERDNLLNKAGIC